MKEAEALKGSNDPLGTRLSKFVATSRTEPGSSIPARAHSLRFDFTSGIHRNFLPYRQAVSFLGEPSGATAGLEQAAMPPTLPGPPTLSQVVALVVPPVLLRFMTSAAGQSDKGQCAHCVVAVS